MSHAPNAQIDPPQAYRPVPSPEAALFDFLHAHHGLHLAFCHTLGLLVHDLHRPETRRFATEALRNLIGELRLHRIQEDWNLCAAMVIEPVALGEAFDILDLVAEGHWRDAILANRVLRAFEGVEDGQSMSESTESFIADALAQLAESLRRHITWEERVAFPFAADHLSQIAQTALVARMREQRAEWPNGLCE